MTVNVLPRLRSRVAVINMPAAATEVPVERKDV
jgi:hypothetical protein